MSDALTAGAGEPVAGPRLIGAPERRALGGEDQRREQLDCLCCLLRFKRLKLRLAEHRLVSPARNGRGLVLGMVLNIISRSLHAVVCRRKTTRVRDGTPAHQREHDPQRMSRAFRGSLSRSTRDRDQTRTRRCIVRLKTIGHHVYGAFPANASPPCRWITGDRGFFRRWLVSSASVSSVPALRPRRVAAGHRGAPSLAQARAKRNARLAGRRSDAVAGRSQ